MKITPEGLKKLKSELEKLIAKRQEISKRIKEAKDLGDLSENAEYSQAREAQALNESRIVQLREMIKKAEVVSLVQGGSSIQIGSQVKIQSQKGTQEIEIVGSQEADPLNGKVSDCSPLGKVLIGHCKGDVVKIKTPNGEMEYKIMEVK